MSDSATSVSKPAALAPWRSALARALHRNRSRPHSRYFQLATVQSNGRPANRTVVFRGFLPDSNRLMMVTDQRSAKVNDASICPWAEACWYFTQTREQFRLAGQFSLVTQHSLDSGLMQARQRLWESLSDHARQQFYWPHPGAPREADAETFEAELTATPAPVFCLGLLTPVTVDHLELRGDPQTRTRYGKSEDDQWCSLAINP